ncbi:MAG TPA: D-alanine--D-alanine ligase [Candidatus Babeliales bacterium]|nr:D-alanine--D-alanine ligase [Candidatus Babeliales bacterium]
MKILVLGGGDSPEREVSLRSAKAVAEAARMAGYEVEEADPKYDLQKLDKISKATIVLPILHGINGEDGAIQRELEKRQLPFLGSDSKSSETCFDKWLTHQKLAAAGLTMPRAALVTNATYLDEPLVREPHVLKIVHGGSSIGTLPIPFPDPPPLKNKFVDDIFKLEEEAIVETMIDGKEITVPILDGYALPVIEIIPPDEGGFNYENKYNGRTQEIVPPKSIPEEVQINARLMAEKVHKTMGCRHLSRIDFMVNKNNKLYILEANTMPGMTEQSLFPKSAAVNGMSMPQLVNKFIDMVKRDYNL